MNLDPDHRGPALDSQDQGHGNRLVGMDHRQEADTTMKQEEMTRNEPTRSINENEVKKQG
jgi:hypothetical protein